MAMVQMCRYFHVLFLSHINHTTIFYYFLTLNWTRYFVLMSYRFCIFILHKFLWNFHFLTWQLCSHPPKSCTSHAKCRKPRLIKSISLFAIFIKIGLEITIKYDGLYFTQAISSALWNIVNNWKYMHSQS